MRSPVRIWVAAPKKALANAGAFWFVRLPPVGGGYCRVWCIAAAARWYPAFAADIRFAVRWAQRPAACPALRSDFRGALHGGCYPRLQARGALHAFFHYYKSQIARDCGAAVPPRLRFRCRVRDFVRARLFHLPTGGEDLTGDAEFRRNCFLPGGTLAHGAPLIRRKIFPRSCALSGEGVFPTDFPFGSRGAKMRSSKLRKTTHFASLRENLFISRNFLLTNGTVCRIINSSVCRNR